MMCVCVLTNFNLSKISFLSHFYYLFSTTGSSLGLWWPRFLSVFCVFFMCFSFSLNWVQSLMDCGFEFKTRLMILKHTLFFSILSNPLKISGTHIFLCVFYFFLKKMLAIPLFIMVWIHFSKILWKYLDRVSKSRNFRTHIIFWKSKC